MKCALLIGITYPKTKYALPGCDNDIVDMYNYLKTCGYTKFIICCDVGGLFPFKTLNTTWSDIQKGFSELIRFSKTNHKSEYFIHYSGHGTYIKDKNNDELDKRDECIVTRDFVLVTDDILNNILRSICSCTKVLCLMDCCHSGTILDLEYKWAPHANKFTTENKKGINTNILMISGCMDKQQSVSVLINTKWQGAQTQAFLKIAKNKPGTQTIAQLYTSCNEYVSNYPQISQISTTNTNIKVNFEENNFNLICTVAECNQEKERQENQEKERQENQEKERQERLKKEKERQERLKKEKERQERLKKEKERQQALMRRRRQQALLRRRRRQQAALRRRRRQQQLAVLRRRRQQQLAALRRRRRRR